MISRLQKNRKGFSLIELVIALSILALVSLMTGLILRVLRPQITNTISDFSASSKRNIIKQQMRMQFKNTIPSSFRFDQSSDGAYILLGESTTGASSLDGFPLADRFYFWLYDNSENELSRYLFTGDEWRTLGGNNAPLNFIGTTTIGTATPSAVYTEISSFLLQRNDDRFEVSYGLKSESKRVIEQQLTFMLGSEF